MTSEDFKVVEPSPGLAPIRLRVPGDKSVSHRLAMLAGLGTGESVIEGFLTSEDCLNTVAAVRALGAKTRRAGTTVRIAGTGGPFHAPAGVLDMGNSGTGMRLLAGLLAGHPFVSEMTGDASLCSRPMARIQKPLEQMGARVELLGKKKDCAPMRIRGGRLRGIEYDMPVASAQVKSCILFAGLFAEGRTTVCEPKPTRDHTERTLRMMGVPVLADGPRVAVDGYGSNGPPIRGRSWTVPGDFSSAAFWIAAAAARPGADLTIENVGLNPRRTALLDVLRRMGAEIEVAEAGAEAGWEPVGTVRVRGRGLKGTDVAGDEIPNLIDELPLVAVLGALAEGRTIIRDAAELRVKESDRISTVAAGLAAFGIKVEERPDGMTVHGGARPRGGAEIDSLGDHRIAMAMAILTLFADASVKIVHVACTETSFPGFWEDLGRLAAG